jgi:hypothetical protein
MLELRDRVQQMIVLADEAEIEVLRCWATSGLVITGGVVISYRPRCIEAPNP